MATQTVAVPCDNSTAVNIKAWSKAVYDAFLAFGWVLAETNIDWNNFNPVPTASTTYGYFIMRTNDALAQQYFVKIEIRSGTTAANPQIQTSEGTGSNGAGGLIDATATRLYAASAGVVSGGAATNYTCKFSGDNKSFRAMMWIDYGTTNSRIWVWERTSKNNDGTETDANFTHFCSNSLATYTRQQSILKSGASPGYESDLLATKATSLITAVFDNKAGITPLVAFVGEYTNPIKGIICLKRADHVEGANVWAQMYGAARNYVVTVNSIISSHYAGGAIGILFE